PPSSTLFPYTTLFRSRPEQSPLERVRADVVVRDPRGIDLAADDERHATHWVTCLPVLLQQLPHRLPRDPLHYPAEALLDLRPVRSEEHTSELQSRSDL